MKIFYSITRDHTSTRAPIILSPHGAKQQISNLRQTILWSGREPEWWTWLATFKLSVFAQNIIEADKPPRIESSRTELFYQTLPTLEDASESEMYAEARQRVQRNEKRRVDY